MGFKSTRSVRLPVPNDADDITLVNLLRAIKASGITATGAQACFGGKCFDITLDSEEAAEKLASTGVDIHDRHYTVNPLSKGRLIHVSTFVPIEYPDADLLDILSRYGKIKEVRRLHMKEPDLAEFENGVRVAAFESIDKPLPQRVTVAGLSIGFKYTGQPKSCVRCSSFDHLVKDCPLRRRHKSTTTPSSMGKVTANAEPSAEIPSPPEAINIDEAVTATESAPKTDLLVDHMTPGDVASTDPPPCQYSEKTHPGAKRNLDESYSTTPPSPDKNSASKKGKKDKNRFTKFVKDIAKYSLTGGPRKFNHLEYSEVIRAWALFAKWKKGSFTPALAADVSIGKDFLAAWESNDSDHPEADLEVLYFSTFEDLYA